MSRKRKELFSHKLISVEEIVDGYYTLKFNRKFDFIPGQVVAIALNHKDDPRLYSIASGNQKDYMRILFDVNPDGLLTPQLKNLKPGDEILVSEPFGKFTFSGTNEWWIATGTGIAPFISMVESGGKLPQKLLHGSRTVDQFLFQNLFSAHLKENYLRFCTRESGGKGIIQGRLTNWLKSEKELPKQIKYYLCGNPEMVVEVRDIILGKGVDFENIIAEIYF
ncbi:oxidoreductase [Labilibacter sediminis]|nr:oxidoreductase [Labilibacter sediminis]